MTSKTILLALGALVLLNGLVGVLLWSGTPPILGDALVGAMPYAPSRRLVISVWPVATQLRSYPDNLVRSPSDHQHSPREVWVHVWTHDVGQHTGMNRIVVLLQLRRLAVLPLLAMSPCLALLLAVWGFPLLALYARPEPSHAVTAACQRDPCPCSFDSLIIKWHAEG